MSKMAWLWGLPTIEPAKQVVDACLSVGIKPVGGGWPIEKDVFHIVVSRTQERAEKGGQVVPNPNPKDKTLKRVDYRPHDPRFAAYNNASRDVRRVFYGEICYHNEQEAWHPNYGMYRFPKGRGENPRTSRFACVGNGIEAERWMGQARGAEKMECPGEGCPFRQGDSPPCMPRARFWFRPRWLPSQGPEIQALERPVMRLATQGRAARDTWAGMLADVRAQAEPVGITIESWLGLPFTITLSEGKNADKGTRWPDITFSIGGDVMEWIGWQARTFKQLLDAPPVLMLGSASPEELDAEEVGAEHEAIVPSVSKPAATARAAEEEPKAVSGVVDAEEVASENGDAASEPAEERKPIGKDGARSLEAFVSEQRKAAAPRAFPSGLTAIVIEAGYSVVPEDLTEDEARAVCRWAKTRARQAPRAERSEK